MACAAQIRGENFSQNAWQAGVHLINGHHSVLSNLHIIGQTGAAVLEYLKASESRLFECQGRPDMTA